MEFIQNEEPDIKKPIIIAAMQDMGNVGSIVVNFINDSLRTKTFRTAKTVFPTYVVDKGGYVELPDEKWELKFCLLETIYRTLSLWSPTDFPQIINIISLDLLFVIWPALDSRVVL